MFEKQYRNGETETGNMEMLQLTQCVKVRERERNLERYGWTDRE